MADNRTKSSLSTNPKNYPPPLPVHARMKSVLRGGVIGSFLVIALVACEKSTPKAPPLDARAGEAAPTGAAHEGSPLPDSGAGARTAPGTTGAGRSLVVWNRGPGLFAIQNVGTTAVAAAAVAVLERKAPDGTFVPLDGLDLGAGYRLVESCSSRVGEAPPSCTEIPAGTILKPVPFRGFSCSSQCNGSCRANGWEGPGTVRLRIQDCHGATLAAGPTFDLPDDSGVPERFERIQFASNLSAGDAFRVELVAVPDMGASAVEGRLAGYPRREETRVALTASDVGDLRALLSAPAGFDDRVAKRCLMSHLVGFRLQREAISQEPTARLPAELSEMLVDFTCNKVFLVLGDRAPRTVLASHFDPSRPAFLRLVKRLFPSDRELQKL